MEELRDLRLFLNLTETLSFGRTSADCHVSPATLTRSIQRLEARAGHRLLDRGPRGVAVTTDGLRFRDYARDALALWQDYRAGDESVTGLQGEVSLFATVTACQALLPDLLSPFRSDHPDVRLKLITGDAAVALARLDEGSVDLALAAVGDRLPESVISQVVASTPLVLIAPGGARAPDLATAAYVLPRGGLGRQSADHWFRQRRIKPRIVAEPEGHEALLTLVALGYGIGVVPQLVLDTSAVRDSLVELPTETALPPIRIGLCVGRSSLRRPVVAELWASIVHAQPEPAS